MEFRTSGGVLTQAVEYTYDVFDRRIGKAVDDDGDLDRSERFVYDGQDVVLVFDGGGSLTTRFLHGPAVDQVFASEDALGDVLWALADHQGSVRDLAEYDAGTGTTSVANHRKYDSFGRITAESNPSAAFRYAYTGRVWDADAELFYYRARWYDPAVGRFLSEDPLGFAAGDVNLTRYVGNSPVNFVDPSGMFEIEWEDTFSPDQMKKILESMERIRKRIPDLIKQIDKELAKLPDEKRDKLGHEARNLKAVLMDVATGISSNVNLEIHRVDDPDSDAEATMWNGGYFFLTYYDAELTFNDDKGWHKFIDASIDRLIFHELTHLYGTEDDDSVGQLMNAHTIDDMINGNFDTSPIWVRMKSTPEIARQYHEPLYIPFHP